MSLTQITQDWKFPLEAPNFTGYMPDPGDSDPAGSILRCFSLTPVPCSQEIAMSKGVSRIALAVVKIIKRGWVNAPYKKPKTTAGKTVKVERDPNVKPLFEEFYYNGASALKVYNYNKSSSPSDKGPRVVDCFSVICPGQTITFFTKSEFLYKENTFPAGVEMIPAYQMLDVTISPSAVTQARNGDKGGYGIKLNKVRLHDSSLYSYLRDLPIAFQSSPEKAQHFIKKMLSEPLEIPNAVEPTDDNPNGTISVVPGDAIRNCLENKSLAFFVPSREFHPKAYVTVIRPDLDFYRVQTPNGEPVFADVLVLDIPMTKAMQMLNTNDDIYTRTLLDIGLAAQAVSFFASSDEWFNKNDPDLSTTRGLPVINTTKLFESVDATYFDTDKEYIDFPVQYPAPAAMKAELAVSVSMETCSRLGGVLPVPTADFMLIGPGVTVERGYEVQFVEGEDDVVLTTHLNCKAGKSFGGTEPGVPTQYQRVSRKRNKTEATEA